MERGRGTAREEGEGILQYGSYVLPQFSEFYTSRAHLYRFRVNSIVKEMGCWDFKEGGSHLL